MKTKFLMIFALFVLEAKSQDVTFSQFNSVPLYFNPAFAGSVEKSRLALSYRNQWSSIYKTMYFSYDQAISKLHGGAGLVMYNDNQGEGSYNIFYTGLVYAPKFNFLNKIAISPAVKIGYRRTYVNPNLLTFGDQIDPQKGFVNSTDTFENPHRVNNNIDISTGLLINTEKFYIGVALDHINQPNVSVLKDGNSKLPIKYVAQLGYTYQKSDESNFSASINLLYQNQDVFDHLQTNLSFRYKWAIIGVGYSTGNSPGESYTAMVGYYSKKLVIGYSYEYFRVAETTTLFDAHELSLKYFFTLKKKAKTEKKG